MRRPCLGPRQQNIRGTHIAEQVRHFQRKGRAVALAFSIIAPTPALAWGNSGHRAIADIAWTQLTPHTISNVNRLLALSPALGTPLCPVLNLEDAAVWADCVRTNYRDRFAHSKTWHYVDVSVDRPFQLPPDPLSRFVVRRLETEIVVLKDSTASPLRRLRALLWVVHLVGDIHQPLHVGDRGDRGGNELRVDGAGWRDAANLHAEWDRDLVDNVIGRGEGGVAGLALEASDRRSLHAPVLGPANWAREAWTLARRVAYGGVVRSSSRFVGAASVSLDHPYIMGASAVVRGQLELAGVRLAATLNTIPAR